MTEINNSLVNLANNKIAEKVYDDVLSNPGKKTGEALGTIINVGNTLLWPIKWANERTRIYFENNLKKYEEKLSKIDSEKIVEVPTEISMPILERFTYVSNEEISEAFINLLSYSSNSDTIQFAHPSFIQVIDRLTPDEAQIIKFFAKNNVLPYITFSKYSLKEEDFEEKKIKPQLNTKQFHTLVRKGNTILDDVKLNFESNLQIYFDNLISLGLIKDISDYIYTAYNDELGALEESYTIEFDKFFKDIPDELKVRAKKIEKGMYELTDFGRLFVNACISK